jgi:hypothetical protein
VQLLLFKVERLATILVILNDEAGLFGAVVRAQPL